MTIGWNYGTGADGDVTISADTDLGTVNIKHYDTLTIDETFALYADAPFRVFCKTALVLNGTVRVTEITGGGAQTEMPNNDGGRGGAGGMGGGGLIIQAAAVTGTGYLEADGVAASNGGDALAPGTEERGLLGNGGQGGHSTKPGGDGRSGEVAPSVLRNGDGGEGGNSPCGGGGGGGQATWHTGTGDEYTWAGQGGKGGKGDNDSRGLLAQILGSGEVWGMAVLLFQGGGGGGGSSGAVNNAQRVGAGGGGGGGGGGGSGGRGGYTKYTTLDDLGSGGGGGGGGGAGGGILLITESTTAITIRARGQNGGNGGADEGDVGSGGGGGGGGGGIALVFAKTGTPIFVLTGGAGGDAPDGATFDGQVGYLGYGCITPL